MSFLDIIIVLLSLSSFALAFDTRLAFEEEKYDPKTCHGQTNENKGITYKTFCIGVKDDVINFPEGTGCLQDYQTCDHVVIGYHDHNKKEYFVLLRGKGDRQFGFYFSKTPGNPGQAHRPLVGVHSVGIVIVLNKDGKNVFSEDTSTAYTYLGPETGVTDYKTAVFKHKEIISLPAISYEVDVNDALYATVVPLKTKNSEMIVHHPSPIKFYSGKRDGKQDDKEDDNEDDKEDGKEGDNQGDTKPPNDDSKESSDLGTGGILAIVFGVLAAIFLITSVILCFWQPSKPSSDPEKTETVKAEAEKPKDVVDPVQQDTAEALDSKPEAVYNIEQNQDASSQAAPQPATSAQLADNSEV